MKHCYNCNKLLIFDFGRKKACGSRYINGEWKEVCSECALNEIKEAVEKEWKHFKKTKIPRCPICKKPMKNAYDNKLKRISPYLWETTCEHSKKTRLSVG